MEDYVLIGHAYNKTVRIYTAVTTTLVETAHTLHGTWPTASAALGRFLTASAMMGLMYKDGERITLRIKGDGPVGSMIVEANGLGDVRGDIMNPEVYMTYHDGPKKGKLAVGKAVGKGFLFVTKDLLFDSYNRLNRHAGWPLCLPLALCLRFICSFQWNAMAGAKILLFS